MKTSPHPVINLILNGMAVALLALLILWAANLAVNVWIRVRHEFHRKIHRKKSVHHKPHEKEDGL